MNKVFEWFKKDNEWSFELVIKEVHVVILIVLLMLFIIFHDNSQTIYADDLYHIIKSCDNQGQLVYDIEIINDDKIKYSCMDVPVVNNQE